jgi:hypothetical protein
MIGLPLSISCAASENVRAEKIKVLPNTGEGVNKGDGVKLFANTPYRFTSFCISDIDAIPD